MLLNIFRQSPINNYCDVNYIICHYVFYVDGEKTTSSEVLGIRNKNSKEMRLEKYSTAREYDHS